MHANYPCTSETLEQALKDIMRKTDEDGRFVKQGVAWAVLTRGLKVSFFGYAQGSLMNVRLEDFLRGENTRVCLPEIAPMD